MVSSFPNFLNETKSCKILPIGFTLPSRIKILYYTRYDTRMDHILCFTESSSTATVFPPYKRSDRQVRYSQLYEACATKLEELKNNASKNIDDVVYGDGLCDH